MMAVQERRREIGVLKAVGWRTSSVTTEFILEGALLAGLGGAVGSVLGVGVFAFVYLSLPTSPWPAILAAVAAVVVGGLAASYPALVASRVPPAEAVRYE